MEPLFKDGEKALASFIPYLISKPKVKDVVIFKVKGKYFVKRVRDIKNGKYFVEGDNKKDSLDSKNLGKISNQEIVAKVIYKL